MRTPRLGAALAATLVLPFTIAAAQSAATLSPQARQYVSVGDSRHRAHERHDHRWHRGRAQGGADHRHPRRAHRRRRRRENGEGAGRSADDRSRRPHGDSGDRRNARPPLLHGGGRSRGADVVHRATPLSRQRRHDDPHHRRPRAVRGDQYTKQAIEAGRVPGPRVHLTAPYITGGNAGSAGSMAEITTPEAARRFVAYWAQEGATWIKAYTDIRRAELGAAIDEAHKRGIKVTGHLCSVSFQEAVELGHRQSRARHAHQHRFRSSESSRTSARRTAARASAWRA